MYMVTEDSTMTEQVTFSGVPGDSRCECADPGCPIHAGIDQSHCPPCKRLATTILYRIDMDDTTGTAFCNECAEDAMDSGLFTDATDDGDADV